MSNFNTRQEPIALCAGAKSGETREWHAFTLIELLVVISIIGVLASLIVGLSGLASRKSKEARIRIEMTKLVSEIENYKSALGFYPPDHPGAPSTNQLYFELSGMVYGNNNMFYLPGRLEPIDPNRVQSIFGTAGFGNAQRDPKDLKFSTEFKASQFKRIIANPPIDVLTVPVKGRPLGQGGWMIKSINGEDVNPWLYVSTSPTNNPDRFDLWTEVLVSGKLMRFSNWEKDPVVLSP